MTCGAEIEVADQLVSEQTFAEGPSGAVHAQGQTIGLHETHRGPGAFAATGMAGSEQTPTYRTAAKNAKTVITRLCTQLRLSSGENEQALRLFEMTYDRGFVRGRSLDDVALVCLYTVVRQATEQNTIDNVTIRRPKYGLMLIDFAEHGDIDVFALGKIFTDLCKTMFFDDVGVNGKGPVGYTRNPNTGIEEKQSFLLAPGPEVFVERFVQQLEFPEHAIKKIRADAYKIIASMRRDWITRGRRPAGVCGAAVIIAARMNNYRRSVREVVLVAKVHEITLNKRLEEFSQTPLSRASVREFRTSKLPNGEQNDVLGIKELQKILAADPQDNLPVPCDPPVMRPKPKKRRRNGAPLTAAEIETERAESEADSEDNDADAAERPAKQPRVDAEGFAIPTQPASSGTPVSSKPSKKKAGRPKGSKNWRAPPPSALEQAIELEIQEDIDDNLPEMQETAARIAATETGADENEQSIDQAAITAPDPLMAGNLGDISMSPTLKAYEFEDDEDVLTCVLNEEERILKETLWVNENADWLRQDHAKRIRRQLKEADLRDRGIDPVQFERNKKSQGRRRKDGSKMPGRHGDVSYLNDPAYERRSGPYATPIRSDRASVDSRTGSTSPSPDRRNAARSVGIMLSQRVPGSTKLNMGALSNIYGLPESSTSRSPTSASSPRAPSIAASEAQGNDSRSRSISIAATRGSSSQTKPTRMSTEEIARTSAQKRGRMRAGLSENTDRSEFIFGATGGKNTGLQRSKASISAEKRQMEVARKITEEGSASGSPSVRPSGSPSAPRGDSQDSSGSRVSSATATPVPPPAALLRATAEMQATPRPTINTPSTQQQQRNVTWAKSPVSNSNNASGANTPTSAAPSITDQLLAGTEEVVEGESAVGERSLITERAPPGAFDDDDDDEEDMDDEDEDDSDDEEEDQDAADVDIDDAFAGTLKGRAARYS